jgi:hypothetical protein
MKLLQSIIFEAPYTAQTSEVLKTSEVLGELRKSSGAVLDLLPGPPF